MDTSASNRRLRVLLSGIRTGELIPRPEFQRRLVWTNKDKCYFIKTVLEGLPFPEIYIAAGKVDAKTGEGSEVLVDGQQRITTLHQYFTDSADIKLSPDIPRYADLDESKQIEFLEYKVVVRDLGALPIDEIKKVFERINSTSYGLNAMELNNSRYGGAFKNLAEWFSQQPTFERLRFFSSSDVRRMNDVRYCLGILSTTMGSYFNRDKDIEEYLSKYDESVPEEEKIRADVSKTLKTIDDLNFDSNSRAAKKSDFFTLFVEINKLLNSGVNSFNISSLRSDLDEFYQGVEKSSPSGDNIFSEYYKASLQASNDRGSRIKRGSIIREILIRNANKA
ncbi:DUF262 domain-containing protein [Pelagicoccus enzymogenes]|uniref:DUF262 domain-containing protein n=1 Tax=Pelagicoccus enzymogenes TaxID=2773457 RepID=UPI00280EBB6C|nr:DUF262 domain-containing protein [Pelagicoccus enzymogenes]MDQ8200510.1 DUF262 domain-containing protein [Pelagicoccus enzymogenes]